jgi:hypothetical protein
MEKIGPNMWDFQFYLLSKFQIFSHKFQLGSEKYERIFILLNFHFWYIVQFG